MADVHAEHVLEVGLVALELARNRVEVSLAYHTQKCRQHSFYYL